MPKIPNWAKATVLFGGIGLAAYFVYRVYKSKRTAENEQANQPKTVSVPVQQFGKAASHVAAQQISPEGRVPAG